MFLSILITEMQMELVAFDYFNIIIYAFVGMILGFLAYDHFRIRFNLSIFEDKTTNLVYLTVILVYLKCYQTQKKN